MSRRANGEGSIYQRKDGRWTGAVYVLNRDGGRQRRQVYGRTRAEVAGKVADLLTLNRQHIPAAPVEMTVQQYAQSWLDRLGSSGLKPATVSNYRWILGRHVLPNIGRHRLVALTPQHVRTLLLAVSQTGASPRTVQLSRAVLRSMLADAERDQLIHRNVAALVKGPRVEREEVVPWTADEAGQFLASLEGHRLRPLFAVGVALGLRKGELLALRWQDVDLDRGVMRVRATVQRLGKGVGLVTGSPKTARSRRTLPLPQVLVDALREHRDAQELERKETTSWHDAGLVFTTSKGTMIEPRNLNRFLDEAIARAGLRRIRFHDLRHTCASLLLAQGVSPRVVMEVLGHSQMSMTTDLYGHVMLSSLRSAADALDGVFGG
ncbi:tyrosine-type recombinase/integrase [Janibacter hoylei]|uniref:tyrosine-type recombinase/integrase n=1 Tax=Janibacter hoylei TaxID=364298 RepID=UPI0021A6BAAA|nr:site-specific integrase [Janibacter hoylei]MCT1619302.1 site-specific integrase [Janibacter hoylei]MCT2294201.1 site-specific integrase [Janibacter hoylei]